MTHGRQTNTASHHKKQMGPTLPPAPRSPACARSILGDRHSVCLALSICWHRCPQALWIGVAVVPEGTGFHRPATLPASGPVRRLVWALRPFPSTWRFRDHYSALSFRAFRSASGRSLQLCFCRSRPLVKQSADIAPFAAFAVRQILPEGFLRRVFQHCCGHRCQIVRLTFSLSVSAVSRWNFKCGSTLSTPESCASQVSRASEIVRKNSRRGGQVCG